jgi:hypothetical protein
MDTLARRIIDKIIEPRRQHWLEKLLWLALWLREVDDEQNDPLWGRALIVADALEKGHKLQDIPLFQTIAERTVFVFQQQRY